MQGRNFSAAEGRQNHSRAEKADAHKKQWRDSPQGVIRKHPAGRCQKGNQDQHSIGFKGLSIRFQAARTRFTKKSVSKYVNRNSRARRYRTLTGVGKDGGDRRHDTRVHLELLYLCEFVTHCYKNREQARRKRLKPATQLKTVLDIVQVSDGSARHL